MCKVGFTKMFNVFKIRVNGSLLPSVDESHTIQTKPMLDVSLNQSISHSSMSSKFQAFTICIL